MFIVISKALMTQIKAPRRGTESKMTYIVASSSAKMPRKCWGQYRRVAVLEIEPGAKPAMISERAKGVRRVVETWERLSVGKTNRCAYRRALEEAKALADRLNAAA